MTLEELIVSGPGGRLVPADSATTDPGATVITSIVHRAADAGPGALFCALPGLRADGHDFAAEAVARGAAAAMVERPLPGLGAPQLVVGDARLGMALAAVALAGHPSEALTVVGVTGTNGKTTSAFLLRAVLEAAGHRCGLIGTIEARVGGAVEPVHHTTPDAVDLQVLLARMRDAGDTACAMEVSSHALMQRRVAGTRFAAALFTNLTRDHLDYHPDVEDYFAAKRRLFARPAEEGADPPGTANLDDEFGRRLVRETGALGFAVDAAAEVRPEAIRGLDTGIAARIATPRGPVEVESRLRGGFNLSNITGVAAVAELLDLPHEALAAGIASVGGVPGRFEAIEAGQPFPVIVDYAHTPDSLDNVLRAARELVGAGRLIVVFGCGGDRDRGKRPQMGAVARRLADVAVVTSDNPRTEDPDAIIAEILAGAEGPAELVVEPDRRAAIGWAIGRGGPGDVVVIAGKGHEQGQERHGVVTPFDDRDVARSALTGSDRMKLTVNDILRSGVEARLPVGSPDVEFDGAFVDSREPVPGALFVGLRGELADGGQHAPDALRDGAAAAVAGESAWRWIEGDMQAIRRPVIVSSDPLAVLQAAGRLALERSGARVVAVTGATGKTTTKDVLVAMLRAAGVAAEGTPGNRNTEVGVPMSLLGLAEGCEVAVVEMGMRGQGQIAALADLAPPEVACVTSIGPVHLELLGTVEAVASAKAELLKALRPGGTAVVPDDEPLLEPHIAALDPGVRVIRVGAVPDLDLDLNLSKAWELRNAAAALACCRALGLVPPAGAAIHVDVSAMRGQERPLPGGGVLIEDCYNANPIAMRAALADLAGRPGRRVAVLADMMELGPDEDRYHREIGAAAAAAGIDLLIGIGDRAAGYVAAADGLGLEAVHIATVEQALEQVPPLISAGDVVLLKGSRSMRLERIGAVLAPGG